MELVVNNQFNQMVALKGDQITSVSMDKVVGRQKLVPRDSELIEVALAVGTSFGQKLN
jgi:6-phosphofructokinase 1